MFASSFAAGLRGLRRRPGLVVLIYGVNLALAFVLALPIYFAVGDVVGPTGFGDTLARGFDVVLWSDIWEKAGAAVQALQFQLVWMVPFYLVWKTAAHVGLVHALRGDAGRSFWQGVGRYTGKGFLLALCYLVLTVIGLGAVIMFVGVGLNAVWSGEVGVFWVNFVILPTLLISVVAVIDLMHDYARIALVVDNRPVMTALGTGIRWPFAYGRASWLYLAWFVPAALLVALPTLFDLSVTAAGGVAIWGLFLTQQVFLLLRAGVTVGWIGSEVAFFEDVQLREAPLIAEAEAVDAPETPVTPDTMHRPAPDPSFGPEEDEGQAYA